MDSPKRAQGRVTEVVGAAARDVYEGLNRAGFVQPGRREAETSDCCPQLAISGYKEGREDTVCRKENYDYL